MTGPLYRLPEPGHLRENEIQPYAVLSPSGEDEWGCVVSLDGEHRAALQIGLSNNMGLQFKFFYNGGGRSEFQRPNSLIKILLGQTWKGRARVKSEGLMQSRMFFVPA